MPGDTPSGAEPTRYLEDFRVGEVIALGQVTVDEEELLTFGRRFDPHPWHTDPVAAAATPFGGLIASGWHTGAMWMRCYVDAVLTHVVPLGGQGMDELRMPAPVRPGDVLTATAEVIEARPSGHKPDRGTLTVRGVMTNQDGVVVMAFSLAGRIGRRPAPRMV